MLMRILPFVFFGFIFSLLSCDEGSSEDCSGAYCPFVANWKIKEVFLDGNKVVDDYNAYRLNLKAPAGGEVKGNYNRTFANSIEEAGEWELTNNNDVILLHVNGESETYIVEAVSQAELILVIEREASKVGTVIIRIVFGK